MVVTYSEIVTHVEYRVYPFILVTLSLVVVSFPFGGGHPKCPPGLDDSHILVSLHGLMTKNTWARPPPPP